MPAAKRKSAKRSAKRSAKHSAKRSVKRSTKRSVKHSVKRSAKRSAKKRVSKKKRSVKRVSKKKRVGGANKKFSAEERKEVATKMLNALDGLKNYHNKVGAYLKGIKSGTDTIVDKLKRNKLRNVVNQFIDNGKVIRFAKNGKNAELKFSVAIKKIPEKYQEGLLKDYQYVEKLWKQLIDYKDETAKERGELFKELKDEEERWGENKMSRLYKEAINLLKKHNERDDLTRFAGIYARTYNELLEHLKYGYERNSKLV